MPRRKAVVPVLLNVQQFIERIAVRNPGGAFLIGGEKITFAIDRERDGKANAGAIDFAFREVG